ncbi:hypothetical protein GEMRC1_012197 [Eukaryota sp. GEM-RC1]
MTTLHFSGLLKGVHETPIKTSSDVISFAHSLLPKNRSVKIFINGQRATFAQPFDIPSEESLSVYVKPERSISVRFVSLISHIIPLLTATLFASYLVFLQPSLPPSDPHFQCYHGITNRQLIVLATWISFFGLEFCKCFFTRSKDTPVKPLKASIVWLLLLTLSILSSRGMFSPKCGGMVVSKGLIRAMVVFAFSTLLSFIMTLPFVSKKMKAEYWVLILNCVGFFCMTYLSRNFFTLLFCGWFTWTTIVFDYSTPKDLKLL